MLCSCPFFLLAATSSVLTGQHGVTRGFADSKSESSEGLVGLCDLPKSGTAHQFGDVAGSLRKCGLARGQKLLGKQIN
jgi:hypothetical protein